jgi:cytochrome c oxidase subunit II
MRKHPFAQMMLLGLLAAIVGTAIVLFMDWFPEQGDTAAKDIDTLYDVLLIASVPIFVFVMTIAIYSVVKFRARPGDQRDGAPIHGNTLLEIVWVTIPFVIVSALAIYGWIVLDDIEAKKPNELVVNVTGQQFTWTFEYPEYKVKSSELVLPKSRPVDFRIRAKDVIHSFWVPEFRLKSDAVPGLTTKIRLTPNKVGEWQVVCAELCGLGHSTMRQEVSVRERGEFAAWVRDQRGGSAPASGGEAASQGKQLFTEQGCGGCHTLADAGTSSSTGPSLDDLRRVAARRKPGMSATAYVRESIVEPDAFTPKGFSKGVMPNTFRRDLDPEQLDALVKYLLGSGQ